MPELISIIFGTSESFHCEQICWYQINQIYHTTLKCRGQWHDASANDFCSI